MTLTKEESEQITLTLIDDEYHAAKRSGYRLLAYGIVMRGKGDSLCWFNRAHGEFCSAIALAPQGQTIAFVGLCERAPHYLHMSHGHETTEESTQVKELVSKMLDAHGTESTKLLYFGVSSFGSGIVGRAGGFYVNGVGAMEPTVSKNGNLPN